MMEQVLKKRYRSPMKLSVVEEEQHEGKNESYFIVSPSQRYFKRVLNKEYLTQKKEKPKQKLQISLANQSKSFRRSPQCKTYERYAEFQQPNNNELKQQQESVNNFSIGLFRKSNFNDNNSLFDSTSQGQRKSQERKLNFNKIFIVQQNTPFKQVIQLSERQLENKEMLEKAVQQLQKRKLQKKYKMLKKQMKIDLSKKKKLDQSIQDLRSHRIGYKTFYKNQVLTQRVNSLEEKQIKHKQQKADNNEQLSNQNQNIKMKFHMQTIEQKPENVNIFLSNDKIQTRKRHKTNADFSPNQKTNNYESIPRQKRRKLVFNKYDSQFKQHVELPSLKQTINDARSDQSRRKLNFEIDKKRTKLSVKQKISHTKSVKSLTQNFKNTRQLPVIIKSTQSLSRNLRNSQKLLRPSQKLQQHLIDHSIKSKTQEKQQNIQVQKIDPYNDQFTLLLSKQELQNTLNKSRYEMKKLLCIHIQNRKKQWRKNKSKSLLDQFFFDQQYRQMTKSERKFINELKPIQETSKQIQNSRYFDQVRSTSALIPAPTHLLKLHTKQLKKSIKSFVKKIKANQSPKKNIKNSPYLQ